MRHRAPRDPGTFSAGRSVTVQSRPGSPGTVNPAPTVRAGCVPPTLTRRSPPTDDLRGWAPRPTLPTVRAHRIKPREPSRYPPVLCVGCGQEPEGAAIGGDRLSEQ